MSKKKILLIIASLLVIVFTIGITGAYFMDADKAQNIVKVGGDTTVITENFPTPTVTPGGTGIKEIKITNTGSSDCYVRVQVEFTSDEGAKDYCTLMYNGEEGYNAADWTYQDGWYYYNTKLEIGQSTTPLYDSYVFADDLTGVDDEFDILVRQESKAVENDVASAIAAWS